MYACRYKVGEFSQLKSNVVKLHWINTQEILKEEERFWSQGKEAYGPTAWTLYRS